jgi:CRP-like cAMP-binding protein
MFEAKNFKKGDLIIDEDTTRDIAYLIQTGSVEVFKMQKGRRIVLSKLGVGNIIGEMSLITGEAPTASVSALEDTGVNAISREDFEKMLNTNPRSIIPILKEAFRKLIYMNQIAVAFQEKDFPETESTNVETKKAPRLRALTADAKRVMPSEEIEISKVPFSIGRKTSDGAFVNVDLQCIDKAPYQLSRIHCVVAFVQNNYYIIDTTSTLGTSLDGVRIGKSEAKKNALLEKGTHTLILGSPTSSYHFALDIPN